MERAIGRMLMVAAGIHTISACAPDRSWRSEDTADPINFALSSANDVRTRVASMKEQPTSGTTCLVLRGYSAADDGGGGLFCWDGSSTAAEDNGTLFKGNCTAGSCTTGSCSGCGATGRWRRQLSGPINVRWFGARGDGSTDDTAAIQAAVDYAAALSGSLGGDVYVPPGVYMIYPQSLAVTPIIQLKSGVHLFGAGAGSVIRLKPPGAGVSSGSTYRMFSTGTAGVSNVQLTDLQIDGNRSGVGAAGTWSGIDTGGQHHAIFVSGCTGCVLQRLRIHDANADAIMIFPNTAPNQSYNISNNTITSIGRVAINAYGAQNAMISNNFAYNMVNWAYKMEQDPGSSYIPSNVSFVGNVGYHVGGGLAISGTAGGYTTNVTAVGNNFDMSSGRCFNLRYTDHIAIKGNTCKNPADFGIALSQEVSDIVVAGNTIMNTTGSAAANASAISVSGTSVIVANNSISNVSSSPQAMGILVASGHQISLQSNVIRDSVIGMVVTGFTDLNIANNVMKSSVAGSYGLVVSDGVMTRLTVANNSFGGHASGVGMMFTKWANVSGLILNGNDFTAETTAIQWAGARSSQQISANTKMANAGSTTISGASTTAAVSFVQADSDASYSVTATISSVSGTFTVPNLWITGKTDTGFTINLSAAPGTGNSLTVDWRIGR